MLLQLLVKICGPLPEDVDSGVRNLSLEQLEELGEALLGFQSLQDLQAWFDANVSEPAGH